MLLGVVSMVVDMGKGSMRRAGSQNEGDETDVHWDRRVRPLRLRPRDL